MTLVSDATVRWQVRRIEELEAEVANLKDKIRMLERAARRRPPPMRADAFTAEEAAKIFRNQELRLIEVLLGYDDYVPVEIIRDAMWPAHTVADANGFIRVLMCKIRTKLAASGVPDAILNRRAHGYRVTDEARRFLTISHQGRAR